MPIYPYKCVVCEREFDRYKSVRDRHDVYCCDKQARRLIPSVQGKPVIVEGYSEMANAYFTGPKQREKVLREKNLAKVD